MFAPNDKKYFYISAGVHLFVLLVFVLSVEFAAPLPVIQNSNKQDVISAVVLGDTAKSKILPDQPAQEEIAQQVMQQQAIAISKALEKKKLAQQKALAAKKLKEHLAKDLLADMQKQNVAQKKLQQKKLKTQFAKTLRQQTEKSLRQQLLNEDIKLKGTQSREAQGEVNKFKALILQAISEHWIIPTLANKRSYCMLLIRLAPGGMVLDVQVTKSSGDPSLDSSARAAVLKASPLPVPPDADAFAAFRQFALKMKPENVL